MKILSLFDGISVARVALEKAGIPIELYWAIEIDKYATQVSQKNYPNTMRTSDVRNFFGERGSFDLLIGGSPCQDLSIAKKDRKGLDGDRSSLFWEYVRIRDEVKPKFFILENVNSMPKEARTIITEALGVEPVMIDAALVSAQRRKRLFWVGKWNGKKYETVPIPQPEDRGILLKDILENNVDDKYCVNISEKYGLKGLIDENDKAKALTASMHKGYGNDGVSILQYRRTYWRETKGGKVPTLTANMGTGGNNVPYVSQRPRGKNKGGKHFEKSPTVSASSFEHNHSVNDIRKLTPIECERLQSLPDNYTEGVSNTQRFKCLGNAFNAEVVSHILKHLPMI